RCPPIRIYKISFSSTDSDLNPSNFSIFDINGKAINPSGDIAAELYGAAEVLLTLQSTSSESTSGQQINVYEAYALDSKQQEDKAAVMGTIGGLIASLGASIKTKAVEKGVEKGSEKLITKMIEWAANSARVGGQTGVDITGTVMESTGIDALQAQTFAAARFFQKSAEEQSKISNIERSEILNAIRKGEILNINKITDAWDARMKVNVLDDTAIQIGKLGDRAKRIGRDNIKTYAANAIPFGSTVSFMLFGLKDVTEQASAVTALIEDAFVNTSIKSKTKTEELFGKEGKAETLVYLYNEGFFNNQKSLVDQHAAEEARLAAAELAKLEKIASQKLAEAQSTARSKAAEEGANEGRARLAAIMQEKLNGVPDSNPKRSELTNASRVKRYWKEQVSSLKNDKDIWNRSISAAFKKWKKAEDDRKQFEENTEWWDYFDKLANERRKNHYYYYGLLGTTSKDAIDEVIAWAQAQYDVASQKYDIARNKERASDDAFANKKALEEAQKAIAEANAAEKEREYAYDNFPKAPIPGIQLPEGPGGQPGCTALGCPQPGIDQTELDRKQTEQLIADSAGDAGPMPTGTWGGYRVTYSANGTPTGYEPIQISFSGSSISSVKIADPHQTNHTYFSEDFESGLGGWQTYGSPTPAISNAGAQSGSSSFSSNGDSSSPSGAAATTTFELRPGLKGSFYSLIYATGAVHNPWQFNGLYLSNDAISAFASAGCCSIGDTAGLLSLPVHVWHIGDMQNGSILDKSIYFREAFPGSNTYQPGVNLFPADGTYGTWQNFSFEINGDGSISYYHEGKLKLRTDTGLMTPYFGQQIRVGIDGREQGSENLIDNIRMAVSSHFVSSSSVNGKNSFAVITYGELPQGGNSGSTKTIMATANEADLGNYDYLTWGSWVQAVDGNADNNFSHTNAPQWIAGQLTPAHEIPTSSTASYNGSVAGQVHNGTTAQGLSGTANLQANFGARTLTGQFSNMRTADGNAWKTLNVNAGWSAGVNSISGSVSGGGASGTVNGNFFGPHAAETGGTWQTTAGAEKAAGIYRAKKQ
ncbi:MAG: transferrin-binding protein-like solute binding protein, partial [Gammaproteobacteria bacterium]|nr:transferrin-binding protein-like solute binding protein [Gammaproteobacteria bacterium]